MDALTIKHIKSVAKTGIPILARVISGDNRWMLPAPHDYQGKIYNSGLIYEHRLIMEFFLGRNLTTNEIVHHKDGNKLNNKYENLELMTREEHTAHHAPSPEMLTLICNYCGIIFQRRKNKKKYKHDFCCLSHSVKFQMQEMHRTTVIKHGTQSGYRHGCRCDLCRTYQNNRMVEYRKSKNKDNIGE